MNKLWAAIVDLLYPGRCPFCRRFSKDGAICPDCQKELPFVTAADACRAGRGYGRCVVCLYYEGIVRDAILRFKFRGKSAAAPAFGALLAQRAEKEFSGGFDTVTWVPLSHKRRRKRGYDQAYLLAKEACRIWGIEPLPLLKKIQDTPPQSRMNAARRRANVLGVFQAQHEENIAGRRILLIDDVLTTGATLAECAGVLRRAGAAEVMCAVLATPRPAGKREQKHEL